MDESRRPNQPVTDLWRLQRVGWEGSEHNRKLIAAAERFAHYLATEVLGTLDYPTWLPVCRGYELMGGYLRQRREDMLWPLGAPGHLTTRETAYQFAVDIGANGLLGQLETWLGKLGCDTEVARRVVEAADVAARGVFEEVQH